MAALITLLVLIYLAVGIVVGLAFVLRGVNRVDPVAAESPFIFRLVILPGCVGLWPVVLKLWLGGVKEGGGA